MPDQVIRVVNGASLIVRTGAILGVGPSGPIGPQGETGPQGVRGTVWIISSTTPTQEPDGEDLKDGDLWPDSTGKVWMFNEGTGLWENQNYSIRGPTGPAGPIGPQGVVGPAGPTGSASSGFNTFNDLLPTANKHP